MKYGFEREFFVKNAAGEFIMADLLPSDGCGYLAESRGAPSANPLEAAFMLFASEHKLKHDAERLGLTLHLSAHEKLPKAFLTDALRRFGKAAIPSSRGNIYGRFKPFKTTVSHAGLHVHISNEREYRYTDDTKTQRIARFPEQFDFPKIIFALDEAFASQIAEAGRGKGYYELKSYGIEYRSLPATVDPLEVVNVLKSAW